MIQISFRKSLRNCNTHCIGEVKTITTTWNSKFWEWMLKFKESYRISVFWSPLCYSPSLRIANEERGQNFGFLFHFLHFYWGFWAKYMDPMIIHGFREMMIFFYIKNSLIWSCEYLFDVDWLWNNNYLAIFFNFCYYGWLL